MQFSPEHALFKPYGGIRHQNDLGKLAVGGPCRWRYGRTFPCT
jgi:hypothetical protein